MMIRTMSDLMTMSALLVLRKALLLFTVVKYAQAIRWAVDDGPLRTTGTQEILILSNSKHVMTSLSGEI